MLVNVYSLNRFTTGIHFTVYIYRFNIFVEHVYSIVFYVVYLSAMGLPSGVGGAAATALGSMLFTRGISGARLVAPGKKAQVGEVNLTGK